MQSWENVWRKVNVNKRRSPLLFFIRELGRLDGGEQAIELRLGGVANRPDRKEGFAGRKFDFRLSVGGEAQHGGG